MSLDVDEGYRNSEKQLQMSDPKEFKGKTLDIYYYLLKNPGYHGVRKIQRVFNYSSANLAQYHLNKLYLSKIVDKNNENKYGLIEDNEIKLGLMEHQFKIAQYWVPKTILYSLFTGILFVIGMTFAILGLGKFYWIFTYIPALLILTILLIIDGIKISKRIEIARIKDYSSHN